MNHTFSYIVFVSSFAVQCFFVAPFLFLFCQTLNSLCSSRHTHTHWHIPRLTHTKQWTHMKITNKWSAINSSSIVKAMKCSTTTSDDNKNCKLTKWQHRRKKSDGPRMKHRGRGKERKRESMHRAQQTTRNKFKLARFWLLLFFFHFNVYQLYLILFVHMQLLRIWIELCILCTKSTEKHIICRCTPCKWQKTDWTPSCKCVKRMWFLMSLNENVMEMQWDHFRSSVDS